MSLQRKKPSQIKRSIIPYYLLLSYTIGMHLIFLFVTHLTHVSINLPVIIYTQAQPYMVLIPCISCKIFCIENFVRHHTAFLEGIVLQILCIRYNKVVTRDCNESVRLINNNPPTGTPPFLGFNFNSIAIKPI